MDVEQTGVTTAVLQWPDYVVVGIVLSVSAGIGVYYRFSGDRQRTAEEYFVANHSMAIVPLAIAVMVSFISSITMLGISAENYFYGTQQLMSLGGGVFGTLIATYFYLPVFYKLKFTSVFEYLEKRFGVRARLVASLMNFLQLQMYSGVVLFAPSLAIEATTGLSGTMSIIFISLICTFYSTIGGIKAVLVTDIVQAALMFAGIFCVLGTAAKELDGGLSNVWHIATEGGRIQFFDFRLDPTIRHTTWCLLIGGTTTFLSLYAVSQVQVQRLLTAKDLKASQHALALSGPIILSMGLLTGFSGLALYAVYKDCDPYTAGFISAPDEIVPFFAAERMTRIPCLAGIFIAGVFSASLSTISALVNSLTAVAVEDYVKPIYRKIGVQFPEKRGMLICKTVSILIGFMSLALAFVAQSLGSLIEAVMGIFGAINGPIFGMYTLGMFVESANEIGAITGTTLGMVICLICVLGHPKPMAPRLPLSIEGCDNSTLLTNYRNATLADSPPAESYFYLNRISYMWYSPMGVFITLSVGYLTSIIVRRFRPETREVDPDLFVPVLAARIKRRRGDVEKTTGSQVFVLENQGK